MSNKLKAFVRFDGNGNIIPGSVILQRNKPKVGDWKKIDANQCCNPTTTTTTTGIPCYSFNISGLNRATITGIYCNGNSFSMSNPNGFPWSVTICARSISPSADIVIINEGLCV